MTRSIPTRLIALALAAGLAACADSTAPRNSVTDAQLTADVAGDAGDATVLDVSQMIGSEAQAGLALASAAPLGVSSQTASCTYSAGVGRFLCPTVTTPEGLSLDRSYAVYAGGAAQSSYSASATDSINFQTFLTGTLARDARSAWINHTRTMTVSGLAGTETQRTWNGTGVRSDSSHVTESAIARRSKFQSVDAISNVVFKLPRSANPYPQSGSITHDITVSTTIDRAGGQNTRTATRHVVVTFNGTSTAAMTVGTRSCTVDLVTRAVSCP
jgi:hypothetical protein